MRVKTFCLLIYYLGVALLGAVPRLEAADVPAQSKDEVKRAKDKGETCEQIQASFNAECLPAFKGLGPKDSCQNLCRRNGDFKDEPTCLERCSRCLTHLTALVETEGCRN